MARKTQKLTDIRAWVAENVMTSSEAAGYLHISRQAIHNAIKRGSLIPVKEGLFFKDDLDEYDKNAMKMRPKGSDAGKIANLVGGYGNAD